jgi:hypothetical protein
MPSLGRELKGRIRRRIVSETENPAPDRAGNGESGAGSCRKWRIRRRIVPETENPAPDRVGNGESGAGS